jgi:hypothetical protein
MTPEVTELVVALDAERVGVLNKLADLSDQDARRSTVESGYEPGGAAAASHLRRVVVVRGDCRWR